MRRIIRLVVAVGLSLLAAPTPAQRSAVMFRPMLHAHNCYPEEGRWADRLDRALGTGLFPIAIEQDVAWSTASGQSVVSHDAVLDGNESTLEQYFFKRVAPTVDRLLQENRREAWPAIVLHLDFKTNEPEHHRAVWNLLGKYERWLTTAPRGQDGSTVQPLQVGPVVALTESGAGQERDFFEAIPSGGRLRIFGTVPPVRTTTSNDRDVQAEAAVLAPPAILIPSGVTNYRRWMNFSWLVVERGGQPNAGDWTAADAVRLTSLVDRAHAQGLGIRFYTLNGHAPDAGLGWTASYNFGSLDRAQARWRAAIDAGVDFIATDQYEEFARLTTAGRAPSSGIPRAARRARRTPRNGPENLVRQSAPR